MENLKTFLNSHFWLIILIGLAVVAFTVFSVQSACETQKFNRTVDNQSIQSNKAVQEAASANNAAVNVSIHRETEDALRQASVAPELNRRRRNSQNSKQAVEAARKTHHEKKTDTSNLSRSDADNCLSLKRLFPEVRFADCQ